MVILGYNIDFFVWGCLADPKTSAALERPKVTPCPGRGVAECRSSDGNAKESCDNLMFGRICTGQYDDASLRLLEKYIQ